VSIRRTYEVGNSVDDGVPAPVYRGGVIEIITFRLRVGADVSAFRAIDARVQTEVAYQCPGLLRRTLARDGDRWLVLQIWANGTDCDDGARACSSSSLGETFTAFIDPSTLVVDRFGDAA
jgi:hypothetical protein